MQIPLCKDVHNDHWNVYNLIFRLIFPIVITFLAALFTRFWPNTLIASLQGTQVRNANMEGKALLSWEVSESGPLPGSSPLLALPARRFTTTGPRRRS